MMMPLLQLTPEERAQFGFTAMSARHRLHELELFDDDSLVSLLDAYPAERLQAFTMGTDPRKVEEWKAADAHDIPGKELLAAVKRGRLWLNLLRVELVDRHYRTA